MNKKKFSKKDKNKNKSTTNNNIRLNQCDIDILKVLNGGQADIFKIHEELDTYSDQEISLNLSWLTKNNFIKKIVEVKFLGEKAIFYQLDGLGKNYINKKAH